MLRRGGSSASRGNMVAEMSLLRWRRRASCRDQPTGRWYPTAPSTDDLPEPADDQEPSIPGRLVCAECPVVRACRDHAVRARIADGVWGGMSPSERELGRLALIRRDTMRYMLFLQLPVLLDPTEIHDRAYPSDDLPERPCPRCPATIPAGIAPLDRNGPGATCGRTSTYNNGCRCPPCVEAKRADHQARRARRRSAG